MKVAFALLAALAMASPLYAYRLPASGSGELAKELQKMIDLVPLDKMLEITRTYAEQDREMKTVISVLKTDTLKQLVQDVESNPAFQKLINTVENLGLDIRSLINDYNNRIGLGPVAPSVVSNRAITGGIIGYIKDLGDVIPIQQIEALLQEELKNSQVFRDLLIALGAEDNANFYWSIYRNPHYLNLKQQVTQQGVSGLLFQEFFPILVFAASVMKFIFALLAILAVASPLYAYQLPATGSGALAKELQDFFDLVPLDEVWEVSKTYLAQDEQFRLTMDALRSNEMRELIVDIEARPQFKEMMNYMQIHGLDINSIVNDYNKIIGLAPIASLNVANSKITGGLSGYVSDIGKLIPQDKLEELFEHKRNTSKTFNDYLNTFLADDYVQFYLSIFTNSHFLKLQQDLVQVGIDGQIFEQAFPIFVVLSAVIV
ncbi:uncharacterized protein LOC143429931 [Xylocopa sonorina]|uniref:uncharacterized protein LOC143429931 n=1 Tax=Xylocopa sonorina TaxID=1818115 RepID=UPI00403AAB6A